MTINDGLGFLLLLGFYALVEVPPLLLKAFLKVPDEIV